MTSKIPKVFLGIEAQQEREQTFRRLKHSDESRATKVQGKPGQPSMSLTVSSWQNKRTLYTTLSSFRDKSIMYPFVTAAVKGIQVQIQTDRLLDDRTAAGRWKSRFCAFSALPWTRNQMNRMGGRIIVCLVRRIGSYRQKILVSVRMSGALEYQVLTNRGCSFSSY